MNKEDKDKYIFSVVAYVMLLIGLAGIIVTLMMSFIMFYMLLT